MSAQPFALYLTVIVAVIVPPGPTALLCMAQGARHGAWHSGATVAGGICAALCLMLVSALGLGAAIAASPKVFQALQWAGAAYLVYLGVVAFRALPLDWRHASATGEPVGRPATSPLPQKPLRHHFGTGFAVGVSNPKDLLFFGALFPQFLDASRAVLPQLGVLALGWVLVEGLVMGAYAAFGARIMPTMAHWGGGRAFNHVTGAAFVALGCWLALGK